MDEINDENSPDIERKNKRLYRLGGVFVLFIFLLTLFVLTAYMRSLKQISQEVSIVQKEIAIDSNEERYLLNKDNWVFEVLNGAGIPGKGKQIAEQLRAKGYSVSRVGNASSPSYDKTMLEFNSDLSSEIELLISDLRDQINIATYSASLTGSTPSARLIIGVD